MIYKKFYWADNPTFEYRYYQKRWQKRTKNSNEKWYDIAESSQPLLNDKYKPKSILRPFWNYSQTAKIGMAVAFAGVVYFLYKKNLLPKQL